MATVHRIGFTRLDEGGDADGQRRCHIIFVHGLRGHPRRTWAEDADETSQTKESSSLRVSFRALTLRKKASAPVPPPTNPDATQQSSFWLRDLLADDLPEARIWTYGYNADIVDARLGANNKNSVSQHGRDLAVKAARELEDAESIIFVAHSLGGIVVKDALFRSEMLQQQTKFIVFLGTPHLGSSAADWALLASNLAAMAFADSNKRLAGALQIDGEVLANIHEQFLKIMIRRGIQVHSFQEARGMTGVKGLSGKVVGDFSSKVGVSDESIESIDADHRQMVKSVNRDDARYRAICGVLRQFVRRTLVEGVQPANSRATRLEDRVAGDSSTATGIPNGRRFEVLFQRNKKFVGREDTLKDIRERLFGDDGSSLALLGLGGVGKTQVALQIAYWVKEHKPDWSVFWLPVLSMAGVDLACGETARRLGLEGPDKEDPKDVFRRYLESAQSGCWLLIVDNADDMKTVFGDRDTPGLHRHLPENQHGRVLFTTRSTDVALAVADDNVVELGAMSEREAAKFLTKLMPEEMLKDDESAVALLRELTCLPLAISQAAAYIKRNKIQLPRYLSLLRNTQKEAIGLLGREFPDVNRYKESRHAVAATWLVSFEQIRRDERPAADLLSFLSQIEPRAIPQSLLPVQGTEEELVHALGTLRGYAFLHAREDEQTFDMHRLVHLATRGWIHGDGTAQEVRVDAVSHLSTVFQTDDWEQRESWRQYMPHVLKMIEADTSEASLGEDKCHLGYWAARCLLAEGRIGEAVELLERVVAAWTKMLGEDHPSRMASQQALGNAYRANGQVKEAVRLLEYVVTVQAKTLGKIHPDRLASQQALATAYATNGQVKEAVELLEHVVAVEARTLAEDHPGRLASQQVLAVAYEANGQVKEAVELLEHVVAVNVMAENHPDRLASQHSLGIAYEANGQVKEAVKMLEHVIGVRTRTLAEDHPSRLVSQHTLAMVYRANGRIKEAVELLEHVVEVRMRTLSEDHPDRLASQHTLAGAYEANGQVKEAVEMLEHVVAVRTRTLAEDHPDRLVSQHTLAMVYRANGRIKEAVELLEHVVEVRTRTLAEDHSDRLASQHTLGTAYRANGQEKEAVEMLEHVVAVRTKTLAEDHPDRLASQHSLGIAYEINGQVKEAVQLLEHVVGVRTRTLAEDHPSRLVSQHTLAIAYEANGQVKEAVEILEHVVAVEAMFMSPSHPSRIASEEMLAWMLSEAAE